MNNIKDIFYLLRNYKGKVFLNFIYIIIFAVLNLFTLLAVVPFLTILFEKNTTIPPLPTDPALGSGDYWMQVFNHHFITFLMENGAVQTLIYVCIFIVVLTLIKNTILYLSLMNVGTLRAYVIRDLRAEMYNSMIALPLSYFSEERKGDIISKLTNDVNEVEVSTVGVLNGLLKSPILILFYVTVLFLMSWELTLFAFIFLPFSGWVISSVAKSVKGAAKKSKIRLGEVVNVIEETLTGNRIIKAFNAEDQFKERFNETNESFTKLMKKLYKRQYLASPFSETMSFLVIAVVLYYGGSIVLDQSNALDGKFFISYLVLFSQILQPAKELTDSFFKLNKGAASLDRIKEITEIENTMADKEDASDLPDFNSEIEFKNVGFSYPDQESFIKDLNFSVKKGETVALVGPSGGGKSTVANLLARFYDINAGHILIDGKSISEVKTASLRNQMGIVTQDSILFNDSVEKNIALGKQTIDQVQLAKALEISNSAEFVQKLEYGVKTKVGEGGGKLSGGQKQRLSIARAVYKNPPILILDEATSALDTESEKLVQDAINKLMENRTSLVIAHRLSTVQNADKILVIKDGRIAESGTHIELLALNGVYKNLVELQSLGG